MNGETRAEKQRRYGLAYYYRHREKELARIKKYRAENIEKVNAARRAYYAKHRKEKAEWLRAYRARNREEFNRKRRAYYAANPEIVHAQIRRSEANRKIRKCRDAEYYQKRLATSRIAHAKLRIRQGKVYRPRFRCRMPAWAVMGGALDVRSPWLVENMTPEQNAYARELAIERRERSL